MFKKIVFLSFLVLFSACGQQKVDSQTLENEIIETDKKYVLEENTFKNLDQNFSLSIFQDYETVYFDDGTGFRARKTYRKPEEHIDEEDLEHEKYYNVEFFFEFSPNYSQHDSLIELVSLRYKNFDYQFDGDNKVFVNQSQVNDAIRHFYFMRSDDLFHLTMKLDSAYFSEHLPKFDNWALSLTFI
jgi:major membrane immunogen (membrane-anchored lipoprotein)